MPRHFRMRQTVPVRLRHARHFRSGCLPGRTAAPRCVLEAPVCTHAQEFAPHPQRRRLPKQAAPPAETPARQEHSCRCAPPPPQAGAAAIDFPGQAARAAPSKRAHPRRGSRPQIAPQPSCTARWLRLDDSVFAAGRRSERCARAADGPGQHAETGYRWPAPWFRPWDRRANRTANHSKSPRAPAGPFAHRGRRAPAWLPGVAATRRARRDTPRWRPRRGSSRGSAWRDPDVCLRLRPSVQVAFAVTEICRSGAKQVMIPGCTLRPARTALVNYIPPAGSGQNTGNKLDVVCITGIQATPNQSSRPRSFSVVQFAKIMTTSDSTPHYALGSTDAEQARLIRQAALLAPFSERFFLGAGISPGQRALDIGSGVGDVAMLVSKLVGPSGEVVGVERDARSI